MAHNFNPRGHPVDMDAFCLYCQVQYASEANLRRHLQRMHLGTIAQQNLAPLPD